MRTSVLIADDSEVMRKAIMFFLKDQLEVSLVGEAASLDQAVKMTNELHPDVVVLDLHMPERSGVGAIKNLVNGSKILAVTFGAGEEARDLAEHLGADKLLDKMNLTEELVPAIMQLARVS